jgi:pyridoxine/pyridoxamine 5'-phosphate oxidase
MIVIDGNSPQLLLQSTLHALSNAAQQPGHPFRSLVVATVSEGQPSARTVVLRDFCSEPTQITFFTHSLSPKVSHIRQQPQIACLAYDPASACQVRMKGHAHIHTDDALAQHYWSTVPQSRYGDYSHPIPPGQALHTSPQNLPHHFFTVIQVEIHEIDILLLQSPQHKRIIFNKIDSVFTGDWVQP